MRRSSWSVRVLWLVLLAGTTLLVRWLDVWSFWAERPDELAMLTWHHLLLVLTSCLLALVVAVPIAVVITRPRLRPCAAAVLAAANMGQSVPTLAVLALVLGWLGLGERPAIFALWLHSLLPILRNTAEGLRGVAPALIDAGRGMGMTTFQLLARVELPNAVAAIMAGFRTATVLNVGTAALAFLIGGGGLGDWIFTGISMHDARLILAGAIPVALLAVLLDRLLGWLEEVITPQGLKRLVAATSVSA